MTPRDCALSLITDLVGWCTHNERMLSCIQCREKAATAAFERALKRWEEAKQLEAPAKTGPVWDGWTPMLAPYHAANLHWLLTGLRRNNLQLETGDWFGELLYACEKNAAQCQPNSTDSDFDRMIMRRIWTCTFCSYMNEGPICTKCGRGTPPPYTEMK